VGGEPPGVGKEEPAWQRFGEAVLAFLRSGKTVDGSVFAALSAIVFAHDRGFSG
jgi:hypothetical protein